VTVAEYVEVNPPYVYPNYEISKLRAPLQPVVVVPDELLRRTPGPNFSRIPHRDGDADLNHQHPGQPIGQRIILFGRVLDNAGRPVPHTLIETWQVNGAGRYADPVDAGFLPIDPNFTGLGRCITGEDGSFEFLTLRPAAYPGQRGGLYRPSHIHVSVFGPYLASRLITQCYFADDPLLQRDPIFQSVASKAAMRRMTSQFVGERTELNGEDSALAYRWDIVLRGGTESSVTVDGEAAETTSPSQTIGPLYGFALMWPGSELAAAPGQPDSIRIRGHVFDGSGAVLAYPESMLELWVGDQFARTRTDADGAYTAVLTKPAAPAGQAPHVNVTVFARGLLKQAQTRMYFPDEAANATDPVLAAVPDGRRPGLIGRREGDEIVFDIHLQGGEESVFFDF
jgi:protocatechuate 3,4-dioxygenase, beta subunit